jgi:hypothetical protein
MVLVSGAIYCVRMWLEQFNSHPATLVTVDGFSMAMTGLED